MEDFLGIEECYTSEERLVRNTTRDWVQKNVPPLIVEAYEKAYFPSQWIKSLAELGLFGMTLPKEYGGSDASYVAYGLVCQELERGDSALRSFLSVQSALSMYAIFRYGSETQKKIFLPKMASAEIIGCFGLTEASSGSDPAGLQTKARKVKGGWELTGSKLWITNASIANLAIVWAKTEEGIRGFIVEKGSEGFSQNRLHYKLSMRASDTGELSFKRCFVPDSHYLPGSECGLKAALMCLTQARYGIAWGAIGAAEACFDRVRDYVLERRQFGKPLGSFQLVQKDLADMLTELVKAQCLNVQLGRLADHQTFTAVQVSMAKMNAAGSALNIARGCRNLLGANGISLEYDVMRHLMNLETVFTYEGTDNVHHLVLGKHITGLDAFS